VSTIKMNSDEHELKLARRLGKCIYVRWTRLASRLYHRYIKVKDGELICIICNRVIYRSRSGRRGADYLHPVLSHFRHVHPSILLKEQHELIREVIQQ